MDKTAKPTTTETPTETPTKTPVVNGEESATATLARYVTEHGESIDALREDVRALHEKIDAAVKGVHDQIADVATQADHDSNGDGSDDDDKSVPPHPLTVLQRLAKIEERLFGAFVG